MLELKNIEKSFDNVNVLNHVNFSVEDGEIMSVLGSFAPVHAFIEAFGEFGIAPTVAEVREPMGMLKWDHIQKS